MKSITISLKQKEYEKPLEEFANLVLQKFKKRVVSLVLFGSVAKGTAHEGSDIDLLVVLEGVPQDWRKRDALLDDIVDIVLNKYYVRVFPIIVTEKAAEASARAQNPLFYGILTGYKTLYDPHKFFSQILYILRDEILETEPIYIEGGKEWKMAEIV